MACILSFSPERSSICCAKHLRCSAKFTLNFQLRVFCNSKELHVWAVHPGEVQAWPFQFPAGVLLFFPREKLLLPRSVVVDFFRPPFHGNDSSRLIPASSRRISCSRPPPVLTGSLCPACTLTLRPRWPLRFLSLSPCKWSISLSDLVKGLSGRSTIMHCIFIIYSLKHYD